MIRFYNGKILTMRDDFAIEEGEVWVEGDHIAYAGPARETDSRRFDRQVDLKGNLLMPGFKNAHTHSAMTFLRSFADDLPLQQWLQQQVFPMEAKLDGEAIYWFSRLAILEYLTSGITANFDMYFFPPDLTQASIDSGFRTVMCGGINDYGGTPETLERDYLAQNGRHPLISYQLGFHGEYTTSKEKLLGVAELAQKYHAPVYCHNSETKAEVEGCIERYGTTPTVFLESIGMFEYGGGGFHCVHYSEEDLQVALRRGLWVVSNPGSNSKLASGIAPLARMDAMGIRLALGTDGPASNNALDMFREMYLATVLQKLQQEDAAAMPAERVLWMAAVGGAHAMCLPECDCIAEGKQADLIVIDLAQPNMQPEHHLVKNLVYSGSKQNVLLTMVAGRVLYEKGEFFVGEPAQRIYEECRRIFREKLAP